MSELKAYKGDVSIPVYGTIADAEVYLKSEADKVIAELVEKNKRLAHLDLIMASDTIKDLEESHKKEVEQLLMEIAELKAQKAQAEDDCAYWKMSEGNAANAMHETEEYAMQLYKEARHNKYKRCVAMAYVEWLKQMSLCKYPESIIYRRAVRRERKWKELAEKFKEAE